MLCDIIENAKVEKEQLISQGISQGILEVAKRMIAEAYPIDVIMRLTNLSKKQVEACTPEAFA